ncbi:MAG: Transcriptional regulator PA2737, MerR family, partial [uncultured Craurococcus sp.]
ERPAVSPPPQGADRLPHHQRGGGRPAHPAARPPLLGDEIPPAQAVEARRRAALLPARGYRPAAPHCRPALHPGLHHQGRAAAAARGRARRGGAAAAGACRGSAREPPQHHRGAGGHRRGVARPRRPI